MPNIFDSVVKNENDHTNLLRNIMERYPKVAAAILSHLLGQEFSETRAASFDFRTQRLFRSQSGHAIPDIVIDGPGFHCVIEAKIDPALGPTSEQSQGYPGCFEGKGEEHLFFLVPRDWKHRNLVRAGKVHTWQELISEVEKVCASSNDEMLNEALSFWKGRFEMERMTPREKETLSSWPAGYGAIRKMQKAIIQTKGLFEVRNDTFEVQLETPSGADSYGFYLKRAGKYLLWIGMWEKSQTPLEFGYHSKAADWLRPAKPPSAPCKTNNYALWALEPETWSAPEKIYEKVSLFLDSYKAEWLSA